MIADHGVILKQARTSKEKAKLRGTFLQSEHGAKFIN
jgi:hypothetical protein